MKRRRLLFISMFIISLCLSVLIAEISVRSLGYKPWPGAGAWSSFYEYDSTLGWRNTPGAKGMVELPLFSVSVEVNRKGLRGNECSYERTVGKKRILVLGDSFAFGHGVNQNETFSSLLEQIHPDVEVVNAGVSGYGTDQELIWLAMEGIRYSPDIVLLVVTGNDDYDNTQDLVNGIYHKPRFTLKGSQQLELLNVPVPHAGIMRRALYYARHQSALITLAGSSLSVLTKGNPYAAHLHSNGNPFRLTISLIDSIGNLAMHSGGAELVVVTNDFDWHSPGAETYKDFVYQLASRYPLVIDIPSQPQFLAETMTIQGDGHWNRIGNRFVAELVSSFLNRRGIFPRKKGEGS